MDVVFTLDSGGKIILQVQLVLNDDDRKRIQEMVRWLLQDAFVKTPGANFSIVSIILLEYAYKLCTISFYLEKLCNEKETAGTTWKWL